MAKKDTFLYDLNSLVSTYNIDNIYEQYKRFEFLEKLSNYVSIKNSTFLEFGSATGQMTEILEKDASRIVAVDGSSDFIKIAKEKVKGSTKVSFQKSYFEDFSTNESFDCVILHHILEHIADPGSFLARICSYINSNCIIAITVPNSHAMSRQLSVKMNLLPSIYSLSENDTSHGHMRVYDWQTLEKQVEKSGLTIVGRHGLSFKLFSDKQNIEMLNSKIIGEEQIKGLWKLADEYPQFSGAIMIVAKIR
jgi:2-polyprenyl-3-methyl-5-hydroxy-6-metoxy-1,4-benzoquinol methylase